MKAVGIVAEYNPFHSGHRYQIRKIREIFGAETPVAAVMSGDFVQRGEAASYDKFTRAEAAVRGGVSLVIEMPLPWSLSSAESFARGGVGLLGAAGVIDALSFGSESGDPAALAAAAATDGEKEESAAAGEAQTAADAGNSEDDLVEASVLAASELRFSRALRAEPGARLEPVSPPLPAAQAPKPAAAGVPAYPPMPPGMQPAVPAGEKAPPPTPTDIYDFVFQLGAFRDPGIVDDLRQRLEGRGLRTRMERSGKLYLVMVVMRGTDDRAREVEAIAQDMHLGKPLMRSRKPVPGRR